MRIILTILVPLLLPIAIYGLWLSWVRQRWHREGVTPYPIQIPWLWLLTAGVALMMIVIVVTFFDEGAAPNAVYVPPQLKNGEIIPGHFDNQPPKP